MALIALATSATFAAAWMLAGRFGIAASAATIPVVVIVASAAVVVAAMSGSMRRLRAVMEAADRVAAGDYAVRVQESGPPALAALARSFNTMTGRLQDADRLRRDLMADVAHELRTPMTVLQGRLEGLLDGVYPRDDGQIAELLEETHTLSRLIDDLRTLALSDAGALQLQKEPADLVRLAREVVRSMETEAAQTSVALQVTATTEAVVVDLDPVRIREVLTNLLSNALRHTAAGGSVTVAVSTATNAATVAVRDTGVGIAPDEVGRLFDRFYKGSGSRGSGLGLTIAKGIVTAHGGGITASSQLGAGTTIAFTLPTAA